MVPYVTLRWSLGTSCLPVDKGYNHYFPRFTNNPILGQHYKFEPFCCAGRYSLGFELIEYERTELRPWKEVKAFVFFGGVDILNIRYMKSNQNSPYTLRNSKSSLAWFLLVLSETETDGWGGMK